MQPILFFAAAFFSELIGTSIGFGSSTVFLPLALFFLDFPSALAITAVFHLFGNLGRLTFFRKNLDWKILKTFGSASVLATIAGALLVSYAPQNFLKFLLGIFLIAFVFFNYKNPKFSITQNLSNSIAGGAASGFVAGLIGTGGAIRAAVLNAFQLKKEVYISTAAVIAIAVDFTRLPIYIFSGFLTEKFYADIFILFFVALAGSFAGRKIVEKVPQKTFRAAVMVALILFGLKFILDFL